MTLAPGLRPLSWLPLLLFAMACSPESEVRVEVTAPPVAVAHVTSIDIEERIQVTAEIDARHHSVVAAEVSGPVTQILAAEGSEVRAGDPVLAIDPQRRQLEVDTQAARVKQARASLAKERRQADRVRRLHAQNAESVSSLDAAQTTLEIAESNLAAEEAQLGVAEQALADATVTAPFDGIIGLRQVEIGEFVQVGTPLVEFVSLDPLEVIFHVAEIDSGRVAVGQKVAIRVAPFPDEVFEATVAVVYPTIDSATRTLRVKATLENPEHRLRPGLFARAELGIDRRVDVPVVREESLLQRADGSVVFELMEGNRVARRRVEIGRVRDGLVEIVDGLEVGDVVITQGQADLLDGALVEPVRDDTVSRVAASTESAQVVHP